MEGQFSKQCIKSELQQVPLPIKGSLKGPFGFPFGSGPSQFFCSFLLKATQQQEWAAQLCSQVHFSGLQGLYLDPIKLENPFAGQVLVWQYRGCYNRRHVSALFVFQFAIYSCFDMHVLDNTLLAKMFCEALKASCFAKHYSHSSVPGLVSSKQSFSNLLNKGQQLCFNSIVDLISLEFMYSFLAAI